MIVPCRNEEKTITLLLDALRGQTWPLDLMEVVIADGMSSDRTLEVLREYARTWPVLRLRVIENPRRNIPAALNLAIQAATSPFIVRLDAHCVPAPDYVRLSMEALIGGKGENVGGVWDIQPGADTWIARSIAAAAANPVGVGDARYRYATEAGYVDTVPFGAYRRDYLLKLGLYDESLLTNEDYELNTRIRKSQGRIWMDPRISSVYFARATITSLAKQYLRYGRWKVRMLKRYPETLRPRQALPPLFLLGLFVLIVLSIFSSLARFLLLITLVIYCGVLAAASIRQTIRHKDARLLAGIPIAIMTMHFSWGAGFWFGLFES